MRKFTLLAAMLLLCSVTFAQSVEFVRNGEVVVDGSTITVTEVENNEMDPAVHVRNSGGETVPTVLKITSVSSNASGDCSYCGFGSGQCVMVALGTSLARGMNIAPDQVVNPELHWMLGYRDEPKVDATVKYELKTGCTLEETPAGFNVIEEGNTICTITVKFIYDASSINSLNTNSNISVVGNELTYNFDNAATRQLNVYNVTGSLVKSEALETSGTVVLNNMNKGVYIYEVIENGKRIAAHKCVIR